MSSKSNAKEGQRTDADASTWNADQAQRYANVNHGPDGKKFLDVWLYLHLTRQVLQDADLLDIGGGTGPWTEYALGQGAGHAIVLDINPAMLEQARRRLQGSDDALPENIELVEADAKELPFDDDRFNVLASINVGCNLTVDRFREHFSEAYRVAQKGGVFVVTAPNSLLVPFTNAEGADDIQGSIDEMWTGEIDKTPETAKKIVDQLRTVLRATFVMEDDNKPILVTESNQQLVTQGTPIIRRIPGLAVDNNFWTSDDYKSAAADAGWKIESSRESSFADEEALHEYNGSAAAEDRLGKEFVRNPPFLVMKLRKTG